MKNENYRFKKSQRLIGEFSFRTRMERFVLSRFRKFFTVLFTFVVLLTVGDCIGNGNDSLSFKGLFGPMNLLQSSSPSDPIFINYSLSPYVLTKDAPVAPIQPSVNGLIEQCSSNPTLPTGLAINGKTCTISGTPTVNQPATNYTITASNSSQSKDTTIVITVNANPPAALNFAAPAFIFTASAAPAFAPIVPSHTGTITSCVSDVPLPAGLSLGSNCSISGSPTVVQGPTNYTITASNAFGSTSTVISITVNMAPPAALNYAGSPYVFTQGATIATINPTYTGTVTACNSDIPLPTGLSLNATNCAISGTPTVIQPATNYTITASNASGGITFPITITVNMAPPSALNYAGSPFTFTQGATITTVTPSVTGTVTSCTSDIPLPTGLGINGATCAISGTPTTTQTATSYTITASNAFGNTTATISITVNLAPPSALNYAGSPFTFTQGTTITTATPSVTGTVTSCTSDIALPSGLALNATTCAISGTPTTTQTATSYTITASNAFGNTTATISITVNLAPPSALSYAGSPFTFTQGTTITTVTPSVTGTVTSCTSDIALPSGLALNATTCAISGTPTTTQTATSYTITASNAFGNTTATISITVNLAPPTGLAYTPSALVFYRGTAATATPAVTGTVTSCASDVALPGGLTLNATTCAISGTPTGFQASANYTITASNSSGSTNNTVSIMVFGRPPMKTMQTNCWATDGTLDATCALSTSTGQDGQLQKGSNPNFTSTDGGLTVTDNLTGLVWKTCHEGRSGATCATGANSYLSLATATTACNNLNAGAGYASRTNWRLPTIPEIETLVDFNVATSPRTFTAFFPGATASYYYWSSTLYSPDTTKALVLYFSDGSTTWTDKTAAGSLARCVSPGP
ncbi:PF07603 family protein [Leptospira weilii serovar Ranarum str. ICFT]|uniref:PF07603 family protein n=1 Tax=Leptospira weilii serovar Ranarum str. ICFT TaxID=1218598 RepID=N1WMN8_9LEPT|nr:putative Ig domain-containing protein [Leptospira weilii]EMY78482.1 PF07603 family protein [Leptospira weilii serovar Ranarum str. ICFT]